MSTSDLVFFGRRRGRPRRAGSVSSERVRFWVTPEERDRLEEMAKAEAKPMASILRDAVNTYVADYGDRVVFLPSGDRFPDR